VVVPSLMLAAPRAASASPSKLPAPGRLVWDKRLRLLRAPEFSAFSSGQSDWRASRQWLAISVRVAPPDLPISYSVGEAAPDVGLFTSPPPVSANGCLIVPDASGSAEPVLDAGALRFGITVSRRQARRAVARNMVKRVLRESARHRAAALRCAAGERGLAILLRLKAPLPPADRKSWTQVRLQIREECDGLLDQLLKRLEARSGVLLAQSGSVAKGGSPEPDQAAVSAVARGTF